MVTASTRAPPCYYLPAFSRAEAIGLGLPNEQDYTILIGLLRMNGTPSMRTTYRTARGIAEAASGAEISLRDSPISDDVRTPRTIAFEIENSRGPARSSLQGRRYSTREIRETGAR